MRKPKTRQDLSNFLHCASMLEDKVSRLYTELAQKTELPTAKPILVTIADDSHRHSTLLEQMSKQIQEPKVKHDECKTITGEAWNTTEKFAETIKHKHNITDQELTTLAKNLQKLESIIGEEYALLIHAKALQLLAEDLNITRLKTTLKEIGDDEKHHLELIAAVKKALTDKKQEDNAPTVKYQNPDQWIETGTGT